MSASPDAAGERAAGDVPEGESTARTTAEPVSLRRVLGPLDAGALVVGAMIGVGIFFTPSEVARRAGSTTGLLGAWALGGVVALLGAFVFAALARRVPRAGGTYSYLHEAFGSFPAFLCGWGAFWTIQTGGMALMARAGAYNVALLCGEDGESPFANHVAAAAILLLTIVNAFGARAGANLNNLLTATKILTLLGLTALGLALGSSPGAGPTGDAISPAVTSALGPAGGVAASAFFLALFPVLFSYGGWQNVCNLTEEVRRPERNLPLAVIGGTVLVTVLYVLFNLALARSLGFSELSASVVPGVEIGRVTLGDVGSTTITVAIALSAFGVLNGFVLGTPRIVYAMARDGLAFAWLSRLDSRSGAPVRILVVQAVWTLVYVYSASFYQVLDGIVVVDWLFFALAGFACVRLADSPGARCIGGVFGLLSLGIVIGAIHESIVYGTSTAKMALVEAGILGLGALVWCAVALARRRARRAS